MYEIIWSYSYDKHIIRECGSMSRVPAKFIGTLEECQAKLSRFISH
jgi:hypothetical protein